MALSQRCRGDSRVFRPIGLITHVIFSQPSPASPTYDKVMNEPRYWLQAIRRMPADIADSAEADEPDATVPDRKHRPRPANKKKAKLKRDWSESLGTGGTVGTEMYPAKFDFTTSTASCDSAGTPDFVAYNTGLAGSTSQATIIAYDNLYSGCTGTVPLVYWAYNTGARKISDGNTTSGLTSLTSSSANFTAADAGAAITGSNLQAATTISSVTNSTTIVLSKTASATTTTGADTITDVGATIPTSVVLSLDGTQLAFVHNTAGTTSTASLVLLKWKKNGADTISSPEIPNSASLANYSGCTAPCVTTIAFNGSHTDSNSAPYYDYAGNVAYAGGNNGVLHQFTGLFTGTPAEKIGGGWPVTVHSGIVLSSPVWDAGSSKVFVGDASGQASAVTGAGVVSSTALTGTIVDGPIVDSSTGKVFWFSAIAKGTTSTLTDTLGQTDTSLANSVTITEANGSGTVETGNMHAGAFDNLYLTTPSTGFLYFCALNPGHPNHPSLWRVGFTNSPTSGTMNGATAAGPLEIGTSSANNECSPVTEFFNSPTDQIFASVQTNGGLTGCTGACLYSFTAARTVTDGHTTNLSTTVTSATAAFVTGDVGAPIVGTNIPAGATIATRVSGTQITISAAATGTTTTATLTIATFPANSSAGLAAAGGTSGIIIDNAVGAGTLAGASQIYYSISGSAVQTAQSGL